MNLLDKHQVAEKLQISPRQVNNLVSQGVFPPGVRQGKKLLWLSVVVEKHMEAMFQAQLDFEMNPKFSSPKKQFFQDFDA